MPQGTWVPKLPKPPGADEALDSLIGWLRELAKSQGQAHVGLESFLQERVLAAQNLDERPKDENGNPWSTQPDLATNTEPYLDAAAEMCRLGVIATTPVWNKYENQFTTRAQYRITARGVSWLLEKKHDPVLPTEPEAFRKALEKHVVRFGDVYRTRAAEALACFHAQCYYACCVMAGAAAEAILVCVATEKSGNAEEVMKQIGSAGGRKKLIAAIKSQQNGHLQSAVDQFTTLVAYYRDDAAHGVAVAIDEDIARLAVMMLLGLARLCDDRWDELTA
jgi:hypothetical protein